MKRRDPRVSILEWATEAVRNLAPWRSRGFLAVALSVVTGGVAGLMLAASASAYQADQDREDLSGAQVVVLGEESDPDSPLISRASCEGLARLPQVRAAGTARLMGYRYFPRLGRVAVMAVSPQLVQFGGQQILVGADLADRSGLRGPGHLADSDGVGHAYGVAPRQPEGVDLNGSVVVARWPDAQVRSCLVWLQSAVAAEAALPTLVSQLELQGQGQLAVRANPESGAAAQRLLGRSDRAAVLLLGMLVGAASGLFRRLRPADAASYRLSGASRMALFTLVLVEDLICASAFVAAGLAMIAVSGGQVLGPASGLWVGAAGLASLVTSLPVALAVVLPQPIGLVKD
ncbi:MAG: hypothetical protein CVT62_10150 [Actinobacteria bacterium HGW-Actinobacteria-2]|nr:MAG: hypothetical protein CVT62_10150 [Actinobacteria bacterium HGW-Actinobacteria-2]